MLKELLYQAVDWIALIHDKIINLNNAFEGTISDKQMHFLVIGLLGMLMIFAVYPLFKFLAKTDHIMVVSWIYVFTLILVITFAIEIGQRLTRTGSMEFVDIVFGIGGFIAMFAIFAVIRGVINGVVRWRKRQKGRQAAGAADSAYQGRHGRREA